MVKSLKMIKKLSQILRNAINKISCGQLGRNRRTRYNNNWQ